jgi:hypothetical protein
VWILFNIKGMMGKLEAICLFLLCAFFVPRYLGGSFDCFSAILEILVGMFLRFVFVLDILGSGGYLLLLFWDHSTSLGIRYDGRNSFLQAFPRFLPCYFFLLYNLPPSTTIVNTSISRS